MCCILLLALGMVCKGSQVALRAKVLTNSLRSQSMHHKPNLLTLVFQGAEGALDELVLLPGYAFLRLQRSRFPFVRLHLCLNDFDFHGINLSQAVNLI